MRMAVAGVCSKAARPRGVSSKPMILSDGEVRVWMALR